MTRAEAFGEASRELWKVRRAGGDPARIVLWNAASGEAAQMALEEAFQRLDTTPWSGRWKPFDRWLDLWIETVGQPPPRGPEKRVSAPLWRAWGESDGREPGAPPLKTSFEPWEAQEAAVWDRPGRCVGRDPGHKKMKPLDYWLEQTRGLEIFLETGKWPGFEVFQRTGIWPMDEKWGLWPDLRERPKEKQR